MSSSGDVVGLLSTLPIGFLGQDGVGGGEDVFGFQGSDAHSGGKEERMGEF